MPDRFEIVSLGIEFPDYFQGFGTSFTSFEHAVYGIGDTEAEAYDDACEMIAQSLTGAEFEALGLPDKWGSEDDPISENPDYQSEDENDPSSAYYHVGIRYNTRGA